MAPTTCETRRGNAPHTTDSALKDQLNGTVAFQKKLDRAASQFQSIAGPALQSLNAGLEGKNLELLKALSREDWEKKQN